MATAIVDENTESRLDGLRSALAVLAIMALVAFFTSGGLPTRQPGSPDPDADPESAAGPEPDSAAAPEPAADTEAAADLAAPDPEDAAAAPVTPPAAH